MPYPVMAPAEQYRSLNVQEEIALARSAAPASISAGAQILVLGKRGYETAVSGNNGFVCFVERSWTAAFDDPEFWNPNIRGPNCFNPTAVRSVLPQYLRRTEWALAGVAKDQMIDKTRAALAAHQFSDSEAGSLSFTPGAANAAPGLLLALRVNLRITGVNQRARINCRQNVRPIGRRPRCVVITKVSPERMACTIGSIESHADIRRGVSLTRRIDAQIRWLDEEHGMHPGPHVRPERRRFGADVFADILGQAPVVENATVLIDPSLAKDVHRARSHAILEHEIFELLCAQWPVEPCVFHNDVSIRECSGCRGNQVFPICKGRCAVPIRRAVSRRGPDDP
jgi:hypothetical protein